MLNISDFEILDGNTMFYEGVNHYFIKSDGGHFTIRVEMLSIDDDVTATVYGASSLSSAIAVIESMES